MRRRLVSLAITSCLALSIGVSCGKSPTRPQDPATPSPPLRANIKVLIDPRPVIAEASGDRDFPWDFRFNLQVSDSGGVGFTVTSMQTTIMSAQSGATLMSTPQNPFVGIKVPANGQETRQFHMGPYRMENFAREGRVNVKMNFTDDTGNATVFDETVNVQYEGERIRLDP
jgi:hypothetical protein